MARTRSLLSWLPNYLLAARRRGAPALNQPVHLLLCLADHFEPVRGDSPVEVARQRLVRWLDSYPRLFDQFRDGDGRPPQHTFFYPAEEYERSLVADLAGLCRAGFGEIEVQLHHENDTAENLRRTLTEYVPMMADRHGQFSRDASGRLGYAFVHGNWALDNSHPRGQWCGVDGELDVLAETGCFADFTLPSYPSPCQTRTINSIYYAVGRNGCRKSHDGGVEVGAGPRPQRGLLMVQGPLVLDWKRRWLGCLPRIENGCLQDSQPPGMDRLDNWLRARIQVPQRPDWYFVKLHAHGCEDKDQAALLGDAMVRFHADLAQRATADPRFHVHYVTAREMVNLVLAAENGWTGSVADARDSTWRAAGSTHPERSKSPPPTAHVPRNSAPTSGDYSRP